MLTQTGRDFLIEARAVLEDLVRNSDVVYSNLRGDQPQRLGLMYDQLKEVNARTQTASAGIDCSRASV